MPTVAELVGENHPFVMPTLPDHPIRLIDHLSSPQQQAPLAFLETDLQWQ